MLTVLTIGIRYMNIMDCNRDFIQYDLEEKQN